jgi:aspartate aminotransferase
MKLHPRTSRLRTETAFKILARARELERQGRDVVHLEIGQPDFPTPPHICDAAIKAMREGKTGYGPAPGLPELREAIAEDAGRRRGLSIVPEQVIVTPGAKAIIFYTLQSVVGEGDEVIIPDPSFPMYASLVGHSGATPVPLPLTEETGFRFSPEAFRERLTDRTRAIILNTPHNPTGGVLEVEDLAVIAEEAVRRDLLVLSDEIYINFLYDGVSKSIATFPNMRERTVILDGLSKSYAMTGWRVGYGILPSTLVDAFELYNVNIASCTATFNQYGALAAITGPQTSVEEMVAEFRRRRDFLVSGLNTIPGISCTTPRGAFYAFPNIGGTGRTSQNLETELLEQAGVAVLAGNCFGQTGDGYLRLSYANSMSSLETGIERIRGYLAG